MNFLGSEPIVMRSSSVTIRTEFKTSWLNGEMGPHALRFPEAFDILSFMLYHVISPFPSLLP